MAAFHVFVKQQHPHLIFEKSEEKVWWNYDVKEGVYVEMSHAEVKALISQLLIAEGLKEKVNESRIKTILLLYRGSYPEQAVAFDDFDNDDEWFHANNGWVKLDGLRLAPHSPERLSRRKSAVDYDKNPGTATR